jgi:YegS/Rv2252/BmrU family lipid kinase
MARIAFIMNPIAGTKSKDAAWNYIRRVFEPMADCELTMYTTTCAGDGYTQALQYAAQKYNAVIAVGGDGTINEIARGLMHSETTLGIIPMGSGNGLARHLQIPFNVRQAVEIIRAGHTQRIDAAEINGKTFFCTAGIGFDALIGNLFNRRGKRGLYHYIGLSTKEVLQYAPSEYRIYVDGQRIQRRAFLVTFANASQWGNNAYIAPQADISDGYIDIVVLSAYSMIEVPMLLPRLFMRSIDKAWSTETLRGQHIRIIRTKNDYVHFDGESAIMGKVLDINVIPLALNVIVPPK